MYIENDKIFLIDKSKLINYLPEKIKYVLNTKVKYYNWNIYTTSEKKFDNLCLESFMNGKFSIEIQSDKLYLSSQGFEKKDITKKEYSKITCLREYVPKIHAHEIKQLNKKIIINFEI